MLPLCIDLDIDIWPLKSTAPIRQLEFLYWNRIPDDWVNPQIVEFLDSMGLIFRVIDHFHLKPFKAGPIHIDSHDIDFSIAKLNWSTNSTHVMNFYAYKNRNEVLLHKQNKIDDTKIPGRTTHFELNELDYVYSHVIKSPTLLNGNVPHNVANGIEPRNCFSIALRYKDKNDSKFITYSDAVDFFKPYYKHGVKPGIEPWSTVSQTVILPLN